MTELVENGDLRKYLLKSQVITTTDDNVRKVTSSIPVEVLLGYGHQVAVGMQHISAMKVIGMW